MASRGKIMLELALKRYQQQHRQLESIGAVQTLHVIGNIDIVVEGERQHEHVYGHGDETGDVQRDAIEKRQKKRCRSAEDKVAHNKQKYPLLEGCKEICRKKCETKVTNEQRLKINDSYWSLYFSERRLWIDSHIVVKPVVSRKNVENQYSRANTLFYYLPLSTSKVSVCKYMFLRTLGMKTDGIVTEFVKTKTRSGEDSTKLIRDNRGRQAATNKTDKELIKEHIMSYNPQVSHYNLENAPHKRYLEPYLTIVSMWEDYKTNHGNISYSVYQRVFQSENISFGKPSQDDCDVCVNYKAHCKNAADDAHESDSCKLCKRGREHENKAEAARDQYRLDRENPPENTGLFTADMQKIILLPKMQTKEHFFVSRLVVFNETFASLSEDGDFVILWHEAISGRLGVDVASTYIKCVVLCGKDKVLFWVDNCTGQNKNWFLYTALSWCVNQNWGPQSITVKYLERGHTFMRADSIHGSIGRKMKKCPEICTFSDFIEICGKAGSKIKPVLMHFSDFYEFEDGHRNRQSKKIKIPLLNSICEVEFRKGTRTMCYKQDFDEDFQEVEFLKSNFRLDVTPPTKNQPRGIPGVKRENILRLAQSFPPAKRKFWEDIPVNDANADLVASLN